MNKRIVTVGVMLMFGFSLWPGQARQPGISKKTQSVK